MGSLPQLSILKGPTRPLIPQSLSDIFQKVAASPAANNKALIFEDNGDARTFTYSDVDKITNKYARTIAEIIKLKHLEPNPDGDFIVAVNMYPSDHLVMLLLAIWKAGAAYLPLDHAFPKARVEHILRESRPVMVIYDELLAKFPDFQQISLDELIEKSSGKSDRSLNNEELVYHLKDDLAIVLYTSGSTGVPKGVRLPHKVILNRLQWQFKTFPFTQTEKVCVFKTALTFVDSVAEIWGPLINGLAILIIGKALTTDPEKLIDVLDRYKIERLVLVPSLLRSLLLYLEMKKAKNILTSLKIWVCSGEILTVSLAKEFFKRFSEKDYKLCNFYGSTEIMGDVTYHILTPDNIKNNNKVPIGLPVDNTMIYLLDSDFRPVKAGETGELFVAGLNLAAGYVRGRDAERFLDNSLAVDPNYARLYRTGDFARIEKGILVYEGRTDSQVKIRGNRVDLSEIEKIVNSVEGIDKAVILCYQPGEINQTLLAFVTTRSLMSELQIENMLKGQLLPYMVPQVILIEEVPLLVNGKVDRQALLKMYENTNNNNNDNERFQPEIDFGGVPQDQMKDAKVLFETVAAVLGRATRTAISLDANFYNIGGNSLNSILTITKLNDAGYYISIADFIAAIDLGEILERMTSGTTINTKAPIYKSEFLRNEHKSTVLDMITTSFYQKADLERWLIPDITIPDYKEMMDALWEPLVKKHFSFVIKNENGKIVGAALNFDAHDEPDLVITSKLTVIFDFLESIEGPVRDGKLPRGKGKVWHSFMMGTHSTVAPKENVTVMQFMEDEVLRLAKERRFWGIFTTNTSPLTQQLATDVHKYQTMLDYQVNEYVAPDGTKPFGLAPDSQRALVQWKPIL